MFQYRGLTKNLYQGVSTVLGGTAVARLLGGWIQGGQQGVHELADRIENLRT